MNPEIKEQIKQLMKDHLTQVYGGWEHVTDKGILIELKNMWIKLDKSGLITQFQNQGMTYRHFVEIAVNSKRNEDAKRQVEKHFGMKFKL